MNYAFQLLIFLSFLVFPSRNGVVELTNTNFTSFLNENSHVLVKYYNFSMERSGKLFEKLDMELERSNSNWVLVNIDASLPLNKFFYEKYSKYDESGTVLFVNGEPQKGSSPFNQLTGEVNEYFPFNHEFDDIYTIPNLISISQFKENAAKFSLNIYYMGEKDTKTWNIFATVAQNYLRFPEIEFYSANGCKKCQRFLQFNPNMEKANSIIVMKNTFERTLSRYEGKIEERKITKFINNLIWEGQSSINRDIIYSAKKENKTLIIFAIDPKENIFLEQRVIIYEYLTKSKRDNTMTNYKLGVLEKGTKEYRSTLKYYLVSSYYKEIILPSAFMISPIDGAKQYKMLSNTTFNIQNFIEFMEEEESKREVIPIDMLMN